MKSNRKNNQGQVLLIIVMLLATTLTLIFTVSFKSNVDTQLSKLEEESQKALAAAEAGIELALKSGENGTIRLGLSSFSGLAIGGYATTSAVVKNNFIAPYIEKDEQYTFYLGEYNLVSNTFGNSTNQDITICYTGNPSFTATLVKGSGILRYVVNPPSGGIFNNGNVTISDVDDQGTGCPVPENSSISFKNAKRVTILASDISTNSKFITIKALGEGSYLGFIANATFPSQGKTVTSEVTTNAGIVKKIELFQSYPQIPAEFFTTTF
jgi:hypothetical protein